MSKNIKVQLEEGNANVLETLLDEGFTIDQIDKAVNELVEIYS